MNLMHFHHIQWVTHISTQFNDIDQIYQIPKKHNFCEKVENTIFQWIYNLAIISNFSMQGYAPTILEMKNAHVQPTPPSV